MAELSPEGIIKQTLATQIIAAQWRLRRCGLVEFDLAESSLDPKAAGPEDIKAEKIQNRWTGPAPRPSASSAVLSRNSAKRSNFQTLSQRRPLRRPTTPGQRFVL
jgi:hypothetical protein